MIIITNVNIIQCIVFNINTDIHCIEALKNENIMKDSFVFTQLSREQCYNNDLILFWKHAQTYSPLDLL